MFGYVRPFKPDLRIVEFTRYRSVYCGLCKSIGRRYGQLPRLAVTYDMTFMALLLQSFAETEPTVGAETCVLHPVGKRAVGGEDPALDLCADLTLLLSYQDLNDKVIDGDHPVLGRAGRLLLKRRYKKAAVRQPALDELIRGHLDELSAAEARVDGDAAGVAFGTLLRDIFQSAAQSLLPHLSEPYALALGEVGDMMGRWVYWIDAIDDLKEDKKRGEWNPLQIYGTREAALAEVTKRLTSYEEGVDRTLALMPYERDGGIIANIATQGLCDVRETICAEKKLPRL